MGGHSVRFLAEKARRGLKRKGGEGVEEGVVKKARVEGGGVVATEDVEGMQRRALAVLERQLVTGAAQGLGDVELGRLSAAQKAVVEQDALREEGRVRREGVRMIRLEGGGVFADDWDNRLAT